MKCRRLFLPGWAALVLTVAHAQDAQPVPVLTGYLTAPPTASLLQVDARPVRIDPNTDYHCGSGATGPEITNGIPVFVAGSQLTVYGKWKKKQNVFQATSVCSSDVPTHKITGSAVIDAVVPSAHGVTMVADGRLLRMAATPGILLVEPPLQEGGAPKAGEWLDYKAVRSPDGGYTVEAAALHQPPLGPRDKDAWQPYTFVAPSPKGPGKFVAGRLVGGWTLPYDQQALQRLQRVGQSVVPAWEKALPAGSKDKWNFQFYEVKTRWVEGCISFSNGIILTAADSVSRLKTDGQLAGILAGCVAQVLEEETYRARHETQTEIALSYAAVAVTLPALAIPAVIWGETEVSSMPDERTSDQDARVELTYLAAAGYPASDGPMAWEVLNNRHGAPQWKKQPGGVAAREYKAEAENAAASAFFTAGTIAPTGVQ